MKNKYFIHYSTNVHRMAENAVEAIQNICMQYGWTCTIKTIDSSTNGTKWAEAFVDKDGGDRYTMRMVAILPEEYRKQIKFVFNR